MDENDQVYYTMKFVKGITLKKVLEQLAQGDAETLRNYPLPVLLTIFQKVCDAVAFAHSSKVANPSAILKPENIMLGDFGEALVIARPGELAKPRRMQQSVTSRNAAISPAYCRKPAVVDTVH